MNRTDPASPNRKRPSWVLPVVIIVGVVIGMVLVGAAAAMLLVAGLRSGAEYLNGAPITISHETVEKRAGDDMRALIDGDYAAFERGLNVSDENVEYRDDIQRLRYGTCALRKDTIEMRQGGFDNGANIRFKGSVYCDEKRVYGAEITYSASALSRKDAANMNRFKLFRILVTSDNQELIDMVSRIKGQFVSRDMRGKATPALPNDTRTFASYTEYLQALKTGELRDCTQKEAPQYTLTVNVGSQSSISRSSGTAVVNCG